MSVHYLPAGQVVPGHFHWVIQNFEGRDQSPEVMLPYFDEHGTLTWWEQCGNGKLLYPFEVKVIGPIPFPEVPS